MVLGYSNTPPLREPQNWLKNVFRRLLPYLVVKHGIQSDFCLNQSNKITQARNMMDQKYDKLTTYVCINSDCPKNIPSMYNRPNILWSRFNQGIGADILFQIPPLGGRLWSFAAAQKTGHAARFQDTTTSDIWLDDLLYFRRTIMDIHPASSTHV